MLSIASYLCIDMLYCVGTVLLQYTFALIPSALHPWHARSFMDSAVQRLSVALQRTIQRDQVLRSHLRRVQRSGVPADYHECGGDAGYRRSSDPGSGGGGSSSGTSGHRGVSSP